MGMGIRLAFGWEWDNRNESGMTNYRIDRIGTHRHASTRIGTHRHTSAPILTTSTRQNRGRGIKVQFQGFNIGQTAGKVSKQMDSRRPKRQDKKRQRRHRAQDKASMPLKQTEPNVLEKN